MPRARTRKIAIGIVSGVVVLLAALFLPRWLRPDFRDALARALNSNPAFLHLNIPPSPARYPGFAFVTAGPTIPLAGPLEDSERVVGNRFEIQWSRLSKNDAAAQWAAGQLHGLVDSAADNDYQVKLSDCRVIEADSARLKQLLLKSDEVKAHRNQGRTPLVITRSFEGRLELRVKRSSKANADVWKEAGNRATEATAVSHGRQLKVTSTDDDQLTLSWSDPVVFAFEVAEADLFVGHLGSGGADRVDLKPVTEAQVRAAISTPPPAEPKKKD